MLSCLSAGISFCLIYAVCMGWSTVHGPRSTVHFLCKQLCFFFVAMLPLTYLSFVRYAGFVFAFRRFCCGRLQFLLLPLSISFPTPAAALLSPARALGHYTELSARFYYDFFSTFFIILISSHIFGLSLLLLLLSLLLSYDPKMLPPTTKMCALLLPIA